MILNTEFFRSTKLPKPDIEFWINSYDDYDPNTGQLINTFMYVNVTVNNMEDYPEGTVFKRRYHYDNGEYSDWETFEPPIVDEPFFPVYSVAEHEFQATHPDFESSEIWNSAIEQ